MLILFHHGIFFRATKKIVVQLFSKNNKESEICWAFWLCHQLGNVIATNSLPPWPRATGETLSRHVGLVRHHHAATGHLLQNWSISQQFRLAPQSHTKVEWTRTERRHWNFFAFHDSSSAPVNGDHTKVTTLSYPQRIATQGNHPF